MELQQIYKEGTEKLQAAGIEDYALDAWLLLEYVSGIRREKALADPDMEVSEEDVKAYRAVLSQREKRIPLQHLIGEQRFMGLSFLVNEEVLIPRQDTENLVVSALSLCKEHDRILDLCTGSGCILLSVLSLSEVPLLGTGSDISEQALAVAEENARRLGVTAEFIQSDLFENLTGTYELILCNPPYIPTDVIDTLSDEVRFHDPRIALDGGEDGLTFYREIAAKAPAYMADDAHLILEIGSDEAAEVSAILKAAGFTDLTVQKDLSGLDRLIIAMYNNRSEMAENTAGRNRNV